MSKMEGVKYVWRMLFLLLRTIFFGYLRDLERNILNQMTGRVFCKNRITFIHGEKGYMTLQIKMMPL